MAENDIVELFGDKGQTVRRSQTQKPTSDESSPPPILRGSGSGGGVGNAPLHEQPFHQNLFIQEDEMASWLHHPHFYSDLLYSGVVSNPSTQPQSSVSLAPPPPPPLLLSAPYDLPADIPTGQSFMNIPSRRGNIFTGGRVEEAGPSIPVVRQSTQVVSSATTLSSSVSMSCLTPTTVTGGLSHTFAVPGLGRKEKEVVCEMVGTSSLGVSKADKEPIQIQPAMATEAETADEKKRKEREETFDEIEESKEGRGSTSRKRSRTAEMHNISEKKRREKINEKMKALSELIPRCNKSNKASMLDDAIEYMKSLQMQLQMMYAADMQRLMAMGMMELNRPPPFIPFPGMPFPMAGLGPSSYPAPSPPQRYLFPNIQVSDEPSRAVQVPSQQSNQPQFPDSQFAGLQQPPSSQDRSESARNQI